jgi:hypothetical protein
MNDPTCMVTILSSTVISLVRKSAPMVALYWLLNFFSTYWFISEVLPTLHVRQSKNKSKHKTMSQHDSWKTKNEFKKEKKKERKTNDLKKL